MLSKKELLILSSLRQNARKTLTKMSKETRIPISTIFDKLKENENNIIKKHTSLLDFSKLGFNTWAKICLKVNRDIRNEVKDYLTKHPNINSVYKINNEFDFLIEAIFRNIRDLEEFLEGLDYKFNVLNKKVYYIIDDIKREEFMSDPVHLELIG